MTNNPMDRDLTATPHPADRPVFEALPLHSADDVAEVEVVPGGTPDPTQRKLYDAAAVERLRAALEGMIWRFGTTDWNSVHDAAAIDYARAALDAFKE